MPLDTKKQVFKIALLNWEYGYIIYDNFSR